MGFVSQVYVWLACACQVFVCQVCVYRCSWLPGSVCSRCSRTWVVVAWMTEMLDCWVGWYLRLMARRMRAGLCHHLRYLGRRMLKLKPATHAF